MEAKQYSALIKSALAEDLGTDGDITSAVLFCSGERSVFKLLAKDSGTLCGIDVFTAVFAELDHTLTVETFKKDGDAVDSGDIVARVSGSTKSILTGERTALNFISHLSGIATKTRKFVEAARSRSPRADTPFVTVLDTRKTIPGLRALQKYAVATGGGQNHRMGLYDMVMLKDNHIDAAGGITPAVRKIKARWNDRFKIEVEARTLDDVREAMEAGADRIMLDNMDDDTMRQAVRIVAGRAETEASGNMTIERLSLLADSGLTYISFGELTHTVSVFDFSLKQERNL